MRDFAVHLPNRPGELERITDSLSRAGVNLKSVTAATIGNQGVLRLIADDVDAARRALNGANVAFEESEVVSLLLENEAGELAMVAHKLSEAGLNLNAIYVTGVEDDLIELAISVDNPKKAKKVLNAD